MAESASGLILRMTRTFDATAERVFAAWTDPEHFGQWFGPANMKTVSCEIDAKVGGAWRLMGEGENIPGRDHTGRVRPTVSGKYLEIEPPTRLVFTWAWHEKDDFASPRGQESVVTIQFKPVGERTEMVFTQAVFKEEQALAAHNRGWTESFDKLGDFLRRAS
ncbi:MAG TPA: SRPBCC domain-containing protein [Polyangiaceae bacterium]|jgi:uncharacterized protein YndB with AHSA1/START domain|nr:SRPBCC domain-containing protein [Polyangiaceae bacterium]